MFYFLLVLDTIGTACHHTDHYRSSPNTTCLYLEIKSQKLKPNKHSARYICLLKFSYCMSASSYRCLFCKRDSQAKWAYYQPDRTSHCLLFACTKPHSWPRTRRNNQSPTHRTSSCRGQWRTFHSRPLWLKQSETCCYSSKACHKTARHHK